MNVLNGVAEAVFNWSAIRKWLIDVTTQKKILKFIQRMFQKNEQKMERKKTIKSEKQIFLVFFTN